jgi:DNA-binding transcriptional regulator YbjK
MEHLNNKLDIILQNKMEELKQICSQKTKKMNENSQDINYSVKTTLYKINAEQEKKLKSSKIHKNKEQLFSL